MHALHRNLIALAMAGLFASPAAFAQASTTGKANANAALGSAVTPPAPKPALPTQANTRAADAVSAKTTLKETLAGGKTTATGSQNMSAEAKAGAPGNGNWWKEADLNGDGKLSSTEATANAGLSSRFNTIDANKDGFVTDEEYRKFFTSSASQGETHAAVNSAVVSKDVWLKLDANADSKISLAEAKADADITGSFTDIDVDGDGFITQAEYRAYAQTKK
jgi:hypothetical protein